MKKNLIYSFGNILVNTLYPLIVFPYISRVFDVSSIGTYNYYNIVFSYISLLASFGLNLYASREIGKAKNNKSEKNALVSQLVVISIFNMLLALFLIVMPFIYFAPKEDKFIALVFSIMIIANAISVEWYYVAVENQRYIFLRNFLFKIVSLGLIFYFIKSNNDLVLYAFIVVLGLFLNAIINFVKLLIIIYKDFKIKINFSHYKGLLTIFLVEITFRYYGMGDVAIMEKLVTREELGFLTFALSIFNIVSSFLKIIATTLLPRVSFLIASNNMKEFYQLLKKTNSLIFLLSFPAIIGLFYGSDLLVNIFGGNKFAASVNFVKAFCPLILITAIINTIIFQVLYPLGRSRIIIISYACSILINIVLNLILVNAISSFSLIVSATLSNLFILIIFFFNEKEKLNIKEIFSIDILKYSLAFLLSFIFILYTTKMKLDPFGIISLLLGLFIYISVLVMTKDAIIYNYINTKLFKNEK
ncbi:oligosaccharide flippase family protein [Elizabethkingia anophelis]|uniref:oligosaccharide flippase family protein n=1 Tax=Elizabethkingia anophelis TaxID=1117645 RepID=UPI003461B438